MFSPTSGEVSINDWSLRTQLNKIRECLGLCPQHNMLFTDLTVLEHLIFFSKVSFLNFQSLIQNFNNNKNCS